jgi:hypothetical protein
MGVEHGLSEERMWLKLLENRELRKIIQTQEKEVTE